MKKIIILFILGAYAVNSNAQILEWKLVNPTFSSVDPDGAGPATGSVKFTLQIHTVSGTVNATGLSTGWSWQSTNSILPTGSPCGSNSISQPGNITMSSTFSGLGFTYNNVNECSGSVSFITGGQAFDRRAAGTVDGGTISLTTTYVDVFTVTLWTLRASNPQGGFVVINSGNGGSQGAFSTYAVSDALANEYVVNSLTFTTAQSLGSGPLPVTFSTLNANCTNNGVMVRWTTASESNSSHFEVQRSINGIEWVSVGSEPAFGNSTTSRDYQHLDLNGGNALYRIKQVDIDGRFIYTPIVSTSCTQKNIQLVIYPVPARDRLVVTLRSDHAFKTELQVVDAEGKVVKIVDASIVSGSNNFTIDVSKFAQGEYSIHIADKAIYFNKKFSIVR